MKLVNAQSGHSIGVYDPKNKDKTRVHELILDNRIRHFAEADYSEGKHLDKLMHNIIDFTSAAFELKKDYLKNIQEAENL